VFSVILGDNLIQKIHRILLFNYMILFNKKIYTSCVLNFSGARVLAIGLLTISTGVTCALAAAEECAGKADNIARLECYDASAAQVKAVPTALQRSYLTRSWDLDDKDEELLGDDLSPLKPHRGTYLIVRRSSHQNVLPYTPTYAASATPAGLDMTEIKFQISQKAKIFNPLKINFLGFTGTRLWGGYTQQSNWQSFNKGNSSPFRETNYEPELILTFNTGNQYGMKLLNLGYVHQSNGRDLSASRSWNRVYIQGGWETDTLSLMLRGWQRMPDLDVLDDNPDIEDYMGRGEVKLRWEPLDHSQVVDLTLRNNLSTKENRGFVQLDWATPVYISKSTKLHIQITSGYGESLIDYNFHQTTVGLGVSFRDW
jgi:phospholipase A1/A2